MFLLDLFSYEFTQFLQIVLWISVPLIIISVSITVLLHKRRKRRQQKKDSLLPVRELAWQLPPLAQPLLARASKNVFMPKEEVLHWGDEPYKKDCIEDMLQAKQLQIDQLQQQLDTRIKTNWQQSHEHTTAVAQWQLRFDEVNMQIKTFEETLQSKQQEAESYQQTISSKAEENSQLYIAGEEKTAYITQLEERVVQLEQEKEQLQTTITAINDDRQLAEEKLAAVRVQAKEYEQKWEQGSHLLSRIYRELSGNITDDKVLTENDRILEAVA